MRVSTFVIAIVLILAFADVSFPQTPDDGVIVPGERIGRWSLRLSFSKLARMTGSEPLPFGPPDFRPGLREFGWFHGPAAGLYAATRDGRRMEYLEAWLSSSGLASFKTARDIGKDSTQEAVVAAYGASSIQMPHWRGGVRLIFDGSGLAVGIQEGKATRITVFRPGSAKEIWRF